MVAVHHAGFSAAAVFDVYTPQSVSLQLEDSILNRFSGTGGGSLSTCSSGGRTAYPYQRTKAIAYADGLDATPLVSFTTLDFSIAELDVHRKDAEILAEA